MTTEDRFAAASEALGVSTALCWLVSESVIQEVSSRSGLPSPQLAEMAEMLVRAVLQRASTDGRLPRPWATEATRKEAEDDGA